MKKFLCFLLTVCLLFTFAACSPSEPAPDPDTDNPAAGADPAGTVDPGDADGTDQDTAQDDQDETKPDADADAQKPDDTKKEDSKQEDTDKKPAASKPAASKPSTSKPSTSKPSTSKPASDKNDSSKTDTPTSPLNLLNTVWKSYSEDEKFPAAGGDFSEENMKDGAPGKFSVSDSGALASTLAVPEDSAAQLKKAASLTHMMNLNTFTAGAFQLKDSKNADAFAAAMQSSIENRRWVCGFPDKFVILQVDGYVVSVFGAEDLVDTFKAKTLKAYKDAKVYCEKNIG